MNGKYEYLDTKIQNLTTLGKSDSETFLAKDTVTGEILVKKYISLENAVIYEKLVSISNKHLVSIHEVVRGDNNAFVLMDYVQGDTLENLLSTPEKLTDECALNYISQLLDVLSVIHEHGIVHRDISPKNILITEDGILKLIDFNISRIPHSDATKDTTILGTAGYAAPEQFGFRQSDNRTDLYAVGILLKEMIPNPNEQIKRAITTSTAIDPNARYQSATFFAEALECHTLKEEIHSFGIIPGYRTKTWWKMLLATGYYIFMTFNSFESFMKCRTSSLSITLELLAIVLYEFVAILLAFDFLHWFERCPFLCHQQWSRKKRAVFFFCVWFIVFAIGANIEAAVTAV